MKCSCRECHRGSTQWLEDPASSSSSDEPETDEQDIRSALLAIHEQDITEEQAEIAEAAAAAAAARLRFAESVSRNQARLQSAEGESGEQRDMCADEACAASGSQETGSVGSHSKGTRVVVQGVASRPELNGCSAVVIRYFGAEKDRYGVCAGWAP